MKNYLSVGAIFKNESMIMEEWIKHYKFHGVDHIYMIDDSSTDNFIEVLEKYIDEEYVTLYSSKDFPKVRGRQGKIYDLYFKPILHETNWLAILDLDEFLYSPDQINLKNILKNYEDYSKIIVNWCWFNSNNQENQPKSVVEGFTKRAEYGTIVYSPTPTGWDYNGSDGPKAIVNTKFEIKNLGIHDHSSIGPIINLSYKQDSQNPKLLINHYALQSKEYWSKVKMVRGDADCWHPTHNRNWEWFNAWNVGDINDLRLYDQNKDII